MREIEQLYKKGKLVYVYSLVSLFVMYICDGIAYITTMSWIFEISSQK